MQKQHLLMVLFGTNWLSNISTKSWKKNHILCLIRTFLIKIRYRFIAAGGVCWRVPPMPLLKAFWIRRLCWFMASFLYCPLYIYCSSKYRDSCRSFRLLKVLAKSNVEFDLVKQVLISNVNKLLFKYAL